VEIKSNNNANTHEAKKKKKFSTTFFSADMEGRFFLQVKE
jgi:hypothetical protein